MTAVATAWAIAGSNGGRFRVSREDDGDVEITWLCGAEYTFAPEELADAIANLELLIPHGVWLRAHDSDDKDFVVRVVDGELYAAEQPTPTVSAPHVPWAAVKELLAPTPAPEDGMGVAPEYGSPWSGARKWLRRMAGR